jgi:hypothetical protein
MVCFRSVTWYLGLFVKVWHCMFYIQCVCRTYYVLHGVLKKCDKVCYTHVTLPVLQFWNCVLCKNIGLGLTCKSLAFCAYKLQHRVQHKFSIVLNRSVFVWNEIVICVSGGIVCFEIWLSFQPIWFVLIKCAMLYRQQIVC